MIDMTEFIDKNYTYAIVGASENPDKYGYRVLDDLSSAGYNVIPVNPKGGEILGKKAYFTLGSIKEKVDIAVMLVPPNISEIVLNGIKELGIKKVWFQPGSESTAAIEYCEANGIDCVYNHCIMVERLPYD